MFLERALYRRPGILVLDEGTSHLDIRREQSVNAAIASIGITRIIVAPRMETISAAKRKLTLYWEYCFIGLTLPFYLGSFEVPIRGANIIGRVL